MSSHTETGKAREYPARSPHSAVRWSRAAPWFGWAAAAIAAAAAVLFLVQAGLFSFLTPPKPPVQPVIEDPGATSTYDLSFTGTDSANRPYSIKAKKVRQDDADKDIMYLDGMVATFANGAGSEYAMSSATTRYNRKDDSMDMKGNVVVRQGSRFTARMAQALAFIKTKSLTTKEDVFVTFADGTIRSGGMEISDDGNRTRFFNGVTARFGYKTNEGEIAP